MPQSYEEKIPAGHLVRLVNEAIEALDLRILEEQYSGGGTSSDHPKMMLKVLVYAYCKKIYTSRKIAEALEENIHFMWLSGEQTPDFRTIHNFRGERRKAVGELVAPRSSAPHQQHSQGAQAYISSTSTSSPALKPVASGGMRISPSAAASEKIRLLLPKTGSAR